MKWTRKIKLIVTFFYIDTYYIKYDYIIAIWHMVRIYEYNKMMMLMMCAREFLRLDDIKIIISSV